MSLRSLSLSKGVGIILPIIPDRTPTAYHSSPETKPERWQHGEKETPRRAPLLPVSLPELHGIHPRRDASSLALLFAGALLLYAVSTPRTVMLEDDGGFIATAAHAGVAHAPGYPLYVLLGWLASLVPFGSVAWRVHTASGLMGALTCGCIAWLVLRRTGNRSAAYLAAAALAVSEHFWSQAIIADVYTTNTAVVFLTLALGQEAAVRSSGRLWGAAAVVYGLGLANHYPLLVLGSPILLTFAVAAGKDFRARLPSLLSFTILTAAALYGWMVWRSHQPGPINFFGPFHSWGAFLSFVDRSIYAGIDDNVNAGLADKLSYAGHFVAQVVLQFGVLGSLVALWGAVTASRTGWRLGLLGEALTFVSSSFLLIALLGFNYEHLMIAAFRPYPLVAYGILALWLGYGADALMGRVRDTRTSAVPAVWAAAVLAVAALGVWNGRVSYRPHDTFVEEQAQTILDLVEQDGVLVLYQDAYVGPLAYLHSVAGRRPDVRMLEAHGLLFSDRVVQPSWTPAQRDAAWADFFRTVERSAYFQWRGSTLSAVGQRHLGFLRRADPNVAPGTIGIELDDTAKAYFKRLLAMPLPTDAWIAYHRNQMLETYGEFLGLAQASDFPPFDGYIAGVLPVGGGQLLGASRHGRRARAAEHRAVAPVVERLSAKSAAPRRGRPQQDPTRGVVVSGRPGRAAAGRCRPGAGVVPGVRTDRPDRDQPSPSGAPGVGRRGPQRAGDSVGNVPSRPSSFRQAQGTAGSGTEGNGLDPELVEGSGVECEGRGDLGVRFDKLNELMDRKIPEPATP